MTLAELIAEAKRLDEAATKGPWKACEDEDAVPVVCLPPDHDGPIAWNIRGGPGGRADCLTLTHTDAAFIAFARTALPRLVRVAEAAMRMRAKADALRITSADIRAAHGRVRCGDRDEAYLMAAANVMADVLDTLPAFDAAVRGEEP